MIGFLALVVRGVLLAAFTFGFVVLFEHGPAGFMAGVPVEWAALKKFVEEVGSPKPEPHVVPPPTPKPEPVAEPPVEPVQVPAPEAAPAAPSQPPSAWEELQKRPIGSGMNQPVAAPPDTSSP